MKRVQGWSGTETSFNLHVPYFLDHLLLLLISEPVALWHLYNVVPYTALVNALIIVACLYIVCKNILLKGFSDLHILTVLHPAKLYLSPVPYNLCM